MKSTTSGRYSRYCNSNRSLDRHRVGRLSVMAMPRRDEGTGRSAHKDALCHSQAASLPETARIPTGGKKNPHRL